MAITTSDRAMATISSQLGGFERLTGHISTTATVSTGTGGSQLGVAGVAA